MSSRHPENIQHVSVVEMLEEEDAKGPRRWFVRTTTTATSAAAAAAAGCQSRSVTSIDMVRYVENACSADEFAEQTQVELLAWWRRVGSKVLALMMKIFLDG